VCEQCYPKYFQDGAAKSQSKALSGEPAEELEEALFGQHVCPDCGIKFVDFRNSHRLGCARDYDIFRAELMPLLENIHGDTKHCGKTPRNYPKTKKAEAELTQLRQRLKRAVDREDYEEAAKLRDQIRTVEEV
jgi:protein arginine kinase activator